jgi:tRNA A37 threonylcarbamoyladenosine biosynthesis protein TsaE
VHTKNRMGESVHYDIYRLKEKTLWAEKNLREEERLLEE